MDGTRPQNYVDEQDMIFFQCGAAIRNRKEPSQVIRAVLRFLLNHGLQKNL